jgi:hypothetical protein
MSAGPRPKAGIRRHIADGLLVVCVLAFGMDGSARAQDDASPEEVFSQAAKALHEGRAGDAVAGFESLADRGVVDATLSYDRGLAYAMRVRIGAEQPGDLGRAAHGFEEAVDLSRDPHLVDDAGRALIVVRSEVARRRVLAGESVEVDPGRSLGRVLAALLSEDIWAALCEVSALAFSVGLFVKWAGRGPRLRIAGGVMAGVAAPLLLLAVAMTLATRADRLGLREAVVVSGGARPTDERGITVPGAHPLPEGARVERVDAHGAQARVRFGPTDVWVPAVALRDLARAD